MQISKKLSKMHIFITIGLSLLMLLAVLVPVAHAQKVLDNRVNDAYDFPIKPGSEEWRSFRDHADMVEACQVQESILNTMSTAGLVETVLNYPLRIDTFAYEDFQEGFEIVMSRSNALSEILNRKDIATELLAKYKALDPSVIDNIQTPLQKGELMLGKVAFIEILLSQDAVINKMSELERLDLLAEVRIKHQIKQCEDDFYGHAIQQISSSLIECLTERQWEERGDYCWAGYTTSIKTPKGSTVPNTLQWISSCTDWTAQEKAAVDAYWQSVYPAAWKWGSSTFKYNCHSYAWHQQSTSNIIWIMASPSIYWTDGSYSYKGTYPSAWVQYRKMYYNGGDHSAVCMWYWDGANLKGVTSKWGAGPLMNHLHNYSPYYDGDIKIYG